MAYQKTQWKDHIEGVQVGTPVNAVNMNKIEEGNAAAHALQTQELDLSVATDAGDKLIQVWKNGFGQVTLILVLPLKSAVSGTVNLMTLPEAYRPVVAVECPCVLRSSVSGLETGIISIGWGGTISVTRQTMSSNTTLNMIKCIATWYTS